MTSHKKGPSTSKNLAKAAGKTSRVVRKRSAIRQEEHEKSHKKAKTHPLRLSSCKDSQSAAFRAYDIRGIAGKEITGDLAYRIGAAYGTFMGEDFREVVVGRDHRNSSPALANALIRGLRSVGLDVIDIGCVPTPILYFAIAHYKRKGGIQVTASHNPKEYNGFKIQKENAYPIYAENGLFKIRDIALGKRCKASKRKTSVRKEDVVDAYVDHLARITYLSRPLRVIIDCGNGVCGLIPQRVFERLGCQVITLYGEPDGDFPHHIADPYNSSTLVDLQKAVLENNADMGVAYDGDGDRFGIVDRNGRIISGDNLMIILAREALKRNRGPVVVEVRASLAVIEDIKKHGGEPIMSKAGHAYVLDAVFKNRAVFGGEVTGHMYMPLKYYNYDDGIFLSLMIAEIISGIYDFCGYVDELPQYCASREYAIPVADDIKFDVVRRLLSYFKRKKYELLTIDGARVNFGDGWALLRASNTAPQIKCRFEGRTPEALWRITEEMKAILAKYELELPQQAD